MSIRTRLGSCVLMCSTLLLSSFAFAQDWKRPESRDRSSEFVGYVQPDVLYERPLVLPGLKTVDYKQLSFDDKTGARTLLVELPPGWKQPSGYHSSDLEMLVVEGIINIGDKPMGRYSYAYYPAGYAHNFSTEKGAKVLQWWAGAPDYVSSATSRAGTKTASAINGVLYNDVPTTVPGALPKFRDEPFMENSPIHVKLLRHDAETGQMTWVMSVPGGPPTMSGEGHLPLWASSAGWMEGFLIAGDMTMGECLPQGQVVGRYDPNGYFFRPAGVSHGGLSQSSDTFAVWVFRTGPGHWLKYHNSCAEPSVPASGGRTS